MSTGNRALSGVCEHILYFLSYTVFVLFLPVSVFVCLKVVQEYERAVIFRLGRVMPGSMKGPGIFLCLPCVEECFMVDLRTITFDIPPQESLQKCLAGGDEEREVFEDLQLLLQYQSSLLNYFHENNAEKGGRLRPSK
ncbi:unnamed protein product [Hydatigera taeniaeformis]|uniref:PHB domain-containing protein n=1 Tax=Hydatigena taeniaeformis TaxID=6205 RepID=A0A0R3WIW1_HYDTA|nr:unnamed protein product [Hydatigera taeniaeformis]